MEIRRIRRTAHAWFILAIFRSAQVLRLNISLRLSAYLKIVFSEKLAYSILSRRSTPCREVKKPASTAQSPNNTTAKPRGTCALGKTQRPCSRIEISCKLNGPHASATISFAMPMGLQLESLSGYPAPTLIFHLETKIRCEHKHVHAPMLPIPIPQAHECSRNHHDLHAEGKEEKQTNKQSKEQ